MSAVATKPRAGTAKPINAARTPPVFLPALSDEQRIDPYTAIQDAHAVMEFAANELATDVGWGLLSLCEKASERVAAAVTRELAEHSQALHEDASNELAGLLGLLHALDNHEIPLFGAAETLLFVCKVEIDRIVEEHAAAERPK